jgi:hypothetical protein
VIQLDRHSHDSRASRTAKSALPRFLPFSSYASWGTLLDLRLPRTGIGPFCYSVICLGYWIPTLSALMGTPLFRLTDEDRLVREAAVLALESLAVPSRWPAPTLLCALI